MRANIANYNLVTGLSLKEILTKLNDEPKRWKPIAGGTDLMVLLNAGKLTHTEFIDVWGLKEWRFISEIPSHIIIGALSTYSDIAHHPLIKAEFPNLMHSGLETGAVAIQNRGTIGGNIINASPAADTVPALMAYGAEIELVSVGPARWIRLEDFYSGYKKMDLKPNELLSRIRIPRDTKNGMHFYRKIGTRRAQAISKVCVAGFAKVKKGNLSHVHIALGGVTPAISLGYMTQDYLLQTPHAKWNANDLKSVISRDIAPIDDIRSNAKYRLTVAQNVILQFIEEIKQAL